MRKECVSLLKEVVKKSNGKIELLKNCFAEGGEIMATNLEDTIIIKFEGKDGVYNQFDLDKTMLGVYEPSSEDLTDKPEFNFDFGVPLEVPLPQVIEALDYVSKDKMRPVLCQVYANGNYVAGTDGYRLYASPIKTDGDFYLSAFAIKVMKKFKKDKWTVAVGEGAIKITNGDITVISKVSDFKYPDIATLLDSNETYDTKIELPKEIFNFKGIEEMTIELESGKIMLDGKDSGLMAKIAPTKQTFSLFLDTRKVIMPKTTTTKTSVCVSPTLLLKHQTLFFNTTKPTSFLEMR